MKKKFKKSSLGRKSLPDNIDKDVKGIQGEDIYDPYWILENYKPNPKNYKKHDKEQRQALFESVTQHGWVVPMVINLKTGYFVDGHGRVEMAAERGIGAKIGFIFANEKEEASIIATFDSLALMSEVDPAAHQQLLQTAYDYAKENKLDAMKQLTLNLNDRAELIKEGKEKAKSLLKARKSSLDARKNDILAQSRVDLDIPDEVPVTEKVGSEIFEETAKFEEYTFMEIPLLDKKMIFGNDPKDFDILPSRPWNPANNELEQNEVICYSIRSAIEYEENEGDPWGFLSFYTEDHRFEQIWHDAPNKLPLIAKQKYVAVFEPDFSLYSSWSWAQNVYSLFKMRWVARYLQKLGVKIIPQVHRIAQEIAIPKGSVSLDWQCTLPELFTLERGSVKIATMNGRMQHSAGGGDKGRDIVIEGVVNGLINYYEFLGLETVIMYGGLDIQKYIHARIPSDLNVIYMDSYVNSRRKWNKDKKRERKAKSNRKRT